MKRILLIVIVIIALIIVVLVFRAELYSISPKVFPPIISSEPILGQKGEIIIKNNTWSVEIASNNEAKIKGLSNRKVLSRQSGLLFVYDQPAKQSFWMKDMLLPIDMIFFSDNWRIVLIESNILPNTFPKIFGNNVAAQYVLEVNANEANLSGLEVGDQAIFLNK